MILTIHNLPSSTRYVDVKSLLKDKCGLTEIIVDNLVNEGTNKKVTVGLASDDDGALVVRKLNGLFINGQQLYIEDRRRSMADQPYRASTYEPASTNMMQPATTPVWSQNASTSYIHQMPVDQNLLSYSGYGVAPQATRFMDPQPVSVGVPGYSGYQAGQAGNEVYAPNNPRRNQESGDWGTNTRDQNFDTSRHKDRKRRHSPDRSAAANKRSSRFDNFMKGKNPREHSPHQQWAVESQVLHDQERGRGNNGTDPLWEQSRWDDRRPREPEEPWNRNDDRDRDPIPVKVWENEPQQWREEPRRWDNQPKQQWRSPPRPHWESPAKPQWESPPKPQWESPAKPQWESPPKPLWENPQKSQWNTEPIPESDIRQQKPQWNNSPKSQWDNQPKPQWEDRIPVENIRSEWYDHLASSDTSRGNDQDFQPQDRHRYYESRSGNRDDNDRISEPSWNRQSERNFSSSGWQARPIDDERRDRPHSRNGRQGRDDWRDKAATSRDRSGGRQNSDHGKLKEYPSREFKRQVRPEYDAPKAVQSRDTPRHENHKFSKQNANRNRFVQEKITYPPVSERPTKRPVEARYETNKPKTLRSMINKDLSNRGQAIALLAKKIFGQDKPKHPISPMDAFTFKQLKGCIKSRIDVLFGEELSVHMLDVVKRYRSTYPISDDQSLLSQIREKSIQKFEALPQKLPKEKALKVEAVNVIEVKKEKPDAPQSKGDSKPVENTEGSTSKKDEKPEKKSAEPPVPPSVARMKPGQPLTDKQVIQQMKLLRKWEYDQDDIYSLDEVTTRALDDEMAELDNLFTEECSNPVDHHETLICKHITTESLNDFNKTIRLYISKRFLNIQTGLAVRMFTTGKPPKKEAVLQYLKKHKIVASAVKKSVKGGMFMINVTKFKDFDLLCNMETDVIDNVPVTFKALHLIGPPQKINKNQIKLMRHKMIEKQIEGLDPGEIEDVDFGVEAEEDDAIDAGVKTEHTDVAEDDFAKDDFPEAEDFSKDIGVEDPSQNFAEEVNIDNINEDDLEDF